MNRFFKQRAPLLGVGLVILSVCLVLAWRQWKTPKVHTHLKYSYTVLVEDTLLQDGNWAGLWEPLKAQFPDVEVVIRPLIIGSEEKALPPFDLIIGSKAVMNQAKAANLLEPTVMPFVETGYQMIYYRRADRQAIPENWALLNLEGQKYLDAGQEKFLLAAPDHVLTFLPLLVGRSGPAADIFDLMRDVRLSYRSVPLGCQVGCAIRLFEESKSPLLWHTDLYLRELSQRFGEQLGLAPLPKLNGHALRTPRQTLYVGEATQPLPISKAVTVALMESWKGVEGARLIFKNLHRFASSLLQIEEASGDPMLDQLKNIVQNFTVAVDEQAKEKAEFDLRPIVTHYMAAELSASDAAKKSDLALRSL